MPQSGADHPTSGTGSYFFLKATTSIPDVPRPIFATAFHTPLRTIFEDFTVQLDGTMLICFMVFLLSTMLRRVWIWLPLLILGFGLTLCVDALRPNFDFVGVILTLVVATAQLLVCLRGGLLVAFSSQFGMATLGFPLVEGWGTWFWQAALLPWLLLLALTAYGLIVSAGGWRRLVWGEKAG